LFRSHRGSRFRELPFIFVLLAHLFADFLRLIADAEAHTDLLEEIECWRTAGENLSAALTCSAE
jgi:hypothetical protein